MLKGLNRLWHDRPLSRAQIADFGDILCSVFGYFLAFWAARAVDEKVYILDIVLGPVELGQTWGGGFPDLTHSSS